MADAKPVIQYQLTIKPIHLFIAMLTVMAFIFAMVRFTTNSIVQAHAANKHTRLC